MILHLLIFIITFLFSSLSAQPKIYFSYHDAPRAFVTLSPEGKMRFAQTLTNVYQERKWHRAAVDYIQDYEENEFKLVPLNEMPFPSEIEIEPDQLRWFGGSWSTGWLGNIDISPSF